MKSVLITGAAGFIDSAKRGNGYCLDAIKRITALQNARVVKKRLPAHY